MSHAHAYPLVRHGRRRKATGHRLTAAALALSAASLVCAPVAYMLWPKPAPVAADAPSLPITVGGVTFNVPPAAIRVKIQRRPGQQSRIDLSFVWPTLAPPEMPARLTQSDLPALIERIFVTVAASDSTLPPVERFEIIYPRYADGPPVAGADGLTSRRFRAGTPYQGEDLVYDAAAPARFLLRCTQRIGATPGMCLHERRIGGADVTVRFPRDWLTDWRKVSAGIDALIASLRPSH